MMNRRTLPLLALLLVAGGVAPTARAAECKAEKFATYRETSIWRFPGTNVRFYEVNDIAIDADGAPNAYHPQDMGIDELANAYYPKGDWKSVLITDPNDPSRPFVQKSGEFAGYFVSGTTLTNPNISDPTNIDKYLDARRIPYIVFPGNFLKLPDGGFMGDLGIARNRSNGKVTPFVVGDQGPDKHPLREVSIRTAENLGGSHVNPRNGEGAPVGPFVYVVFREERPVHEWPLAEDQLSARAEQQLHAAGGWDAVLACLNRQR